MGKLNHPTYSIPKDALALKVQAKKIDSDYRRQSCLKIIDLSGLNQTPEGQSCAQTETIKNNNKMENDVNNLKLYSFDQARKLLSIGRSALTNFINSGVIGIIKQGKRIKISHRELERFLNESVIREKTESLTLNFNERDVNNFINNNKTERSSAFDSSLIFNNIMENYNNGKRV